MPVTIRPFSHAARAVETDKTVHSADGLLKGSCPAEHKRCKSIIRSSVTDFSTQTPILSSSNGFMRAAIAAYNEHHHLTIRPEDVWFAILTQLSFFVNAHAEELRSLFVSHAGRKELVIKGTGTLHTAPVGLMAEQMTKLMAKNLNDPELLPWIMPDFSTTKDTDKVVASVLMMGAMQKYFSYTMEFMCGIPSVTLLGERADWEEILKRLEKLPNLGSEPGQFYCLLKPVLTYFVASFDSEIAAPTVDFWQKIAHESGGSGPRYICGWITAFCFWDEDGKSLYAPQGTRSSGAVEMNPFGATSRPGCELDGTLYHTVKTKKIPSGFASVPVKVDDNCIVHDTIMVAGSVGIQVTSTGNSLEEESYTWSDSDSIPDPNKPTGAPGLDSLQPVSGWLMYEKLDVNDGEVDETASYLGGKSSLSTRTQMAGMKREKPIRV